MVVAQMAISANKPYLNSLVWHTDLDMLIGLPNNFLILAEVWEEVETTNYAILTFDGKRLYKGSQMVLGCSVKRFSVIQKQ